MLLTMWGLVAVASLAVVGLAAGRGARLVADCWLGRNGYRQVVIRRGLPEFAVGTGWILVGVSNVSVAQLACGLAVVWWCVALSLVDVTVRRLPNCFTLSAFSLVMACALWAGTAFVALAGAVMLAGIHLVIHVISTKSMGAGDVKLALALGALTGLGGAQAWLFSALLAPVVTLLIAVVRDRRSGSSSIPHGPSMCIGALVALALS